MKDYKYYVYILANKKDGTIYIGVTNSLIRRIDEHKKGRYKCFTEKYKVNKLVYFEIFGDIRQALYREKQLKNWHRSWKIELIEKENSDWNDLYYLIIKN